METVSFRRMSDGTKEDYDLLAREEERFIAGLADRILEHLRMLERSTGGYQISRLDHSLQSATRAEEDGADADWIVTALLHDIGDAFAPQNHSEAAAALLAPYVDDEATWVVRHHGLFQGYYYFHHLGGDRNARFRNAQRLRRAHRDRSGGARGRACALALWRRRGRGVYAVRVLDTDG